MKRILRTGRWTWPTLWLALAVVAAGPRALSQEQESTKTDPDVVVELEGTVAEEGSETELQKQMLERLEAQRRELERRLREDPAWKASHQEVDVIFVGDDLGSGAVHNFCLYRDGSVLVGCGGKRFEYVFDENNDSPSRGFQIKEIEESAEIRVISLEGKTVAKWQVDVKPEAICVHRDGQLWVAENGRHRVTRYDRQGKVLSHFGNRDRKAADGFGGCCEPKNFRLGPGGELYTAESGPPVVVKRFTPEGKLLGVVGLPKFKTGCVRVTVEVSHDGRKVFVLSSGENAIHVLADKRYTATHEHGTDQGSGAGGQ